jgi:hypothetical protein
MKHPSDLPTYSKRWMFWCGQVNAAIKGLNRVLREYTEFREKGCKP